MLQSPLFYIIISMFFVGAFSGLMIASQASPIGQSMFGLSAGTAALYVSLYSIANSSGRFIWGSLSDKIGRSQTLLIIYSVIVLALFSLTIIPGQLGFTLGILGLVSALVVLWESSLPLSWRTTDLQIRGGQLRHRLYRIFFSCIFCT